MSKDTIWKFLDSGEGSYLERCYDIDQNRFRWDLVVEDREGHASVHIYEKDLIGLRDALIKELEKKAEYDKQVKLLYDQHMTGVVDEKAVRDSVDR